jgi:hypothetical protein
MDRQALFLDCVREQKEPVVIFDIHEVGYFLSDIARLPSVVLDSKGWRLVTTLPLGSAGRDATRDIVEALVQEEGPAYSFGRLDDGRLGVFAKVGVGVAPVEGTPRIRVAL